MLVLLSFLFAQTIAPPVVSTTTVRPVAACDPNKFLSRAYQDLLGRPIDPQGSTYWLGAMTHGVSRTQVASQLILSPEHVAIRKRDLFDVFARYLRRPASGNEISFFSNMLQQGASEEQVEAAILGSAEYFNQRGGGTNAGFVGAMYQDVLGRAADPAGVQMFSNQLGAGASRTQIAQVVLTSNEARQRRINALYQKYLHRPASGAAPGTLDQVTAIIIGSEEYCRR